MEKYFVTGGANLIIDDKVTDTILTFEIKGNTLFLTDCSASLANGVFEKESTYSFVLESDAIDSNHIVTKTFKLKVYNVNYKGFNIIKPKMEDVALFEHKFSILGADIVSELV